MLWKPASKNPYMNHVKGCVKFPSEPVSCCVERCKRDPKWKVTGSHGICSRRLTEWKDNEPSQAHPDPECFQYNGCGNFAAAQRKDVRCHALKWWRFCFGDAPLMAGVVVLIEVFGCAVFIILITKTLLFHLSCFSQIMLNHIFTHFDGIKCYHCL